MTGSSLRRWTAVAVLAVLGTAGGAGRVPAAPAAWQPLSRVVDVPYVGALDLTREVLTGPAVLPLPFAVRVGGGWYDQLLVGEGYVHFLHSGGAPPVLDRRHPDGLVTGWSATPELGPRIDVLAGDLVHVSPGSLVLAQVDSGLVAIRWTGLRSPSSAAPATAELFIAPDGVEAQYLHVPPGFVADDAELDRPAPPSASAFRLLGVGDGLVRAPLPGPHVPLSDDPPPDGCEPEAGEWCDITGPACTQEAGTPGPQGPNTPCDERVANLWRFREGAFCRDCPYVFYILVECGREMHIPTYDMEGLDLEITNMVTGLKPDLRCINETALGLGPDRSWAAPPSCGFGQPGPWYSPPLDVTNNVGPGHVSFSDSTPGNGRCTTRFDVPCNELPPSGEAPTVVYGEEQTIDCYIRNDTGLCGIYRVDIVSGGFGWELFSNCDGTNTPKFDIFFDCTEAWEVYNPLPELAIANVSAEGDCYTYDISFHVQNIGCVDYPGDVPVRITSECGDVLDIDVDGPVPARGFVPWTEPFTLSCPDGTITFTVDPDDTILECTETSTAAACTAESGVDTLDSEVICCPVVDAGEDKVSCSGQTVALFDASSQFADLFAWDDGGVGGVFDPGPDVRNPDYTPPPGAPDTITLTLTATFEDSGCERSDSLILSIDPDPQPDAGQDKEACAGEPVDLDDATTDFGDEYSWDDGGAGGSFSPGADVLNPSYTNDTGGTYVLTLRVSDSGTTCEGEDQVQVVVNDTPSVDAGAEKEGCASDPIALDDATAGAADDLLWDDGGGGGSFSPGPDVLNPSYSNPAAGTYTLTLRGTVSATGCAATDTVEVTVDANPAADAGDPKQACEGESVRLSDAVGGSADSFQWDDGGAGGSFSPGADVLRPEYLNEAPGTYTLTLTATETQTGCDTVDTVEVTIAENPVVDAGAEKVGCAGEAIPLDDADGGIGDSYTWVDGGAGGSFSPSHRVQNPTYTNPRAGFYTLTLTSSVEATGCEASDSVDVEVNAAPLVEAGSDKSTCADQGRQLDDAFASGGTDRTWDDGGGGGTFSPSPNVLEPTYSNPTPGTYTLTLTATRPSTGCSASDSMVMTVTANPDVEAGADKTTCQADQVPLDDATGGGTEHHWSDGGSGGGFSPSADVLNPSYSNPTPGTYTLTLETTDGEGCTSTDTLTVTVQTDPVTDAGAPKETCVSQPVGLDDATTDTGDTYSWSDGGSGGAFSPSATVLHPTYENPTRGTYTLTLTTTESATGCASSDTVEVTVRDTPTAAFDPIGGPWCEDTPVCFDNTSDDATSWLWDFGDPAGGTSSQFEPCYTYSEPGTFTVQLTASNLCDSDVTTREVTIDPKPAADFSHSTQGNRYCKDRPVDFTDESTANPTSWQWDFGDGGTSTEQNPSHAYATDGLFIVSLVACNDCGCSPPHFEALEIAASCQSNCEANSNQIDCDAGPAVETGDTCQDFDGFNTTSYPCAPYDYSGENKTYDLNFDAGANFIIRLIETEPEPNGYELDLILSDACNPPNCVSWGDDLLVFDDRTAANDDYFLIVDGRDGTCGPYELQVECLSPDDTALCEPPDFDGIVEAYDPDPCFISGILVEWDPARDWGADRDGEPCDEGFYEIWRAPSSDPADESRVGTADDGSTSFLDTGAVPRVEYLYKVHAINSCCAEPTITDVTDDAVDDFGNAIEADAGPAGTITCDDPEVTLLGSASGGTGEGFDFHWTPEEGLSDPDISNPVASLPGVYTMTVTDRGDGCQGSDTVEVFDDDDPPAADAGPDKELTCREPDVILEGSASGGNGSEGYAYSWTPAGPLDDPTAANPRTAEPGTYTLTVEDEATGCTATDTVVVVRNDDPPAADAGPNKELTCAVSAVQLEGGASGGDGSQGYSYAWTPAAGVDDPSSPTPTTETAGTYTLTVTDVHTGCTDTDAVVVVLNDDPPIANAGPDRQLDCSGSDVTLNGSALGGDGSEGYAYAWSPPEAVADPSAEDTTTSIPGTYTLTVTDIHTGCTDTDTVEVSPDPGAPVADAGPDKAITCDVDTVTLEGSASGGDGSQGYTYRWEPAGSVSDPDIAQPDTSTPGTYTLTVTSVADGCVSRDAVVVEDLTGPPTAEAGPDKLITCDEGTVTLEGSASGSDGRDGYEYLWDPDTVSDPTSPTPTTETTGTYTLTVTDVFTGCTDTDTVTVGTDQDPPTAEAGPDKTLTCDDTQVTLEGSASGGNDSEGYTYRWSPDTVSDPAAPDPTTDVPGTYTLTVTSVANGCTDTDTVVVDEDLRAPTADAGEDKELDCAAESVTLDGSGSGGNGTEGYAYRWEPAGAVTDPDAAQTEALAAGTYTLTVTDLANGCTGEDTVVVSSPNAPIPEAGPDDRITCVDGEADLQGSASGGDDSQGRTAEWSPTDGVDDPAAFVTTTTVPATYTLIVEDVATGCRAHDSMEVVDDTEPPVAEAGPDKTLTCATSPVTLDGSATGGNDADGYEYAWEPAADVSDPAAPDPTTSVPGTYTLTVTAVATGCTDQDTVTVFDDTEPPVADAGPDQTVDCRFPTATLVGSASGGNGSEGYEYLWDPDTVSDPTSPTPTTDVAGTYTLTVTDVATGCTDLDTVEVLEDFRSPVAEAGPDKTIDCRNGIVSLEGSASGGNGSDGYDYAWEPEDQVSNPVSPTPVALAPGTYTLTVTDRANGCTDTDTVEVLDNTELPTAEAGPDKVLDCDVAEVTLDGSATGGDDSQGYEYSWEPDDDVSDPSSPTPTTQTPGIYSLTVTAVASGCVHVDTVEVAQDVADPRADAGPDSVIDCDDPEATLDGSASGGNGSEGYTYRWEPAANVDDPDAAVTTTLEPGTYTLTVTSVANGCQDEDTVIVADDTQPPVAEAGPDQEIACDDPDVTLDGSASGGNGSEGYAYEWAPPDLVSDPAVPNPTTSTAGTYTLTVTDLANGCQDTDTVEVTSSPDVPTADAGPDRQIDCDESLVTLLGSASGGDDSQGYTYRWEPADDVSNPNIAQPTTTVAGTYTLTVTANANGCADTDTVVVTRDVEPPVANAGQDKHVDCDQPVVTLDGSASGGDDSDGYDYLWDPDTVSDPTSPTPTTSTPGTYRLTVTARGSGCSDVDTVIVTEDTAEPLAEAGPDKVIDCDDPEVLLEGSAAGGNGSLGYDYLWDPDTVSDPTSPTPTTSVAGTYTLTVTDLANGCTDTDTVEVTEDLREPVADAGQDKDLDCSAESVTLDGSASGGNGSQGYAYRWEPAGGVTDPDVAVTEAIASGTFTLTVTDLANGCTDDDTVVVTSPNAPVADAGPDGAITCDDGVADLEGRASGGDGSQGYDTEWSPAFGVADPSALVTTTTEPATYTLLVEDIATGCRSVDTAEIVNDRDAPTAEAGPAPTITCAEDTVTLQGSASGGNGSDGYDYLWDPDTVSDPTSPTPTTSTPGTYTLTVTDRANGCVDTDLVTVIDGRIPPVAEAGPERVLGCNGEVTLQGSASGGDGSDGYDYLWEPDTVSDPTSPTPTTSTSGTYTLTVTDRANGCTDTDTVEVVDDSTPPVAEAGPTQERTCFDPVVTLRGSASGGNGSEGYSYRWEPAEDVSDPDAQEPTTDVAGTYTLTVTDVANGCTDEDTVVVTEDVAAPVADAGPNATLDCRDESTTLTGSASGGNGSAGYSYRWEPAANVTDPDSATTQALAAGVYTLTVTDLANGCTDEDTTTVASTADPPVAEAGPDDELTCDDATARLAGSGSGGDGRDGYSAEWSPTAGVADPNAFSTTTTEPGTYTLTVTDNFTGCRSFDTMTVFDERDDPPTAEAGDDQSIDCIDDTATLEGSASGGDGSQGYDYRWEPSAQVSSPTSPTTTTMIAGTYTLTVTDRATGCTADDTVEVIAENEPPVAEAGSNQLLTCTVSEVTLDGSASGGDGSQGYTYEWSPASRVSDPSIPNPTTSLGGTYFLLVTDVATGCTGTDTVRVLTDTREPAAFAGPDQVVDCDTPVVTLQGDAAGGNGSQGYDYSWQPAGQVSDPTAQQPTTTIPGTYVLRVTDRANGCVGVDVVTVTEDLRAPVAGAGPDKSVRCSAPLATLEGSAFGGNGSAGYDFLWQPAGDVSDATAQQPTTSIPGTYTVTVTDRANGCTATDEVVVSDDRTPPVAEAGPDRMISCDDPTTVLQGSASGGNGSQGYTYSWSPAIGLSDRTSPTPTATSPGTFTLTVTDRANGCTHSDQVTVSGDLARPVADAGPDTVLECDQESATLEGSGTGGNGSQGYSYRWEPAGAVTDPDSATTSAIATGTFTLSVTDLANGCTGTDTVEVSPPDGAPTAGAGDDGVISCGVPAAPLAGTITGGDGSQGFSVRWMPDTGVQDPTSLTTLTTEPGTYTLLVVDIATGCRAADSVTVADDRIPPVASAGPDKDVGCSGAPVTLDGSATGGNGSAGYAFRWAPAGDLSDELAQAPTTTVPGTYTVTVTDLANGCTATDEVTVGTDLRPPTATAMGGGQLDCTTPAVPLFGSASGGNGTEGYSFSWSPPGGVVDPTAATTQATQPGTYTLTVTDLANGCADTDEVVVTRDPDGPVADAGPDRTIGCGGGIATLTGSASGGDGSQGYQYSWSPAADVSQPFQPTTTTATPGTYVLTITDVATGCVAQDVVTVTQAVPLQPREPSALDQDPTARPLTVEWATPGASTFVRISWEDVGEDHDRLFSGSIDVLRSTGYDHARVACGLPSSEAVFIPADGARYFLAVAANCEGTESSYGRDTAGTERPDAAAASGMGCP